MSSVLFIDGYNYLDGLIFAGMFITYVMTALYEMNVEKKNHYQLLHQIIKLQKIIVKTKFM